MPRNATPRLARLMHVSSNPHQPVIVGRIYQGPGQEQGKIVHIVVDKIDIPAIRAFLDRLEERETSEDHHPRHTQPRSEDAGGMDSSGNRACDARSLLREVHS